MPFFLAHLSKLCMSRCSSRDVLFWSDPSAPEDKAVSAEVAAKDIRLGILLCKRFPLYSREGLKNEVVAVVLADGQRSPTIKPPCAILKETVHKSSRKELNNDILW
mmetsp:Transcript_1202/g.1964  ORF Transcript_1202/g.1964 Transcript_1202/m.1964 type:complete len:106 (-) Transcript_1202:105-422(-)